MKHLSFLFSSIISGAKNKASYVFSCDTILNRKACFLLEDLGYISGFSLTKNRKLKIYLRYFQNTSTVRSLSLLSKQTSRVYIKKLNLQGKGLNSFIKNNSFTILSSSTSFFFLTDIEAFFLAVGGEGLFVVN